MAEKKVIRPKGDTFFVLAHAEVRSIFGKKYKDSYWLECDEDGNIKDHNQDGVIKNETILCKIPDGYDDLDLSTLQPDCLE